MGSTICYTNEAVLRNVNSRLSVSTWHGGPRRGPHAAAPRRICLHQTAPDRMLRISSHTPLYSLATLLLVSGLVGLLGGCQLMRETSTNPTTTLGAIELNPRDYLGETVTVSGEVNEVYGSDSFTIGGDDFSGELLIVVSSATELVSARTGNQPVGYNDIVQVTGTMHAYDAAALEDDFNVDLSPDLDYDDQKPALVADKLYVTKRKRGSSP